MTSFVTGATGFIGSHLVKSLSDKGEDVIALMHSNYWNQWLADALNSEKVTGVYGDILDFQQMMRVINRYAVDTVYHLAAESIVKRAHRDPINTFDINVMGAVKVLEACRQLKVPKVIIQTTDKVYGERVRASISDRLVPTEPYGTSKICMDTIAQSYALTYEMNIAITRPCNIYGYDLNDRIIPNTIRACLRNESPVIFGTGGDKRQYLHVDDLCEALIKIGAQDDLFDVFNLGSLSILSQGGVVKTILSFFPEIEPTYIERPELYEILEQSLITTEFGWKPKYTFHKGIEATIESFRKYGW